jgi:hypothetical protein
MRPCWPRPQAGQLLPRKEWAQKATEKSIGMVDVPLLSVPTLAEELRITAPAISICRASRP